MKGLFHWRLLGAHLLRRRAGCLQPENSGPFVLATGPYSAQPVPRLLSVVLGQSIPSNQSHVTLIISPVPADRSSASCPILHATVAPCSQKKTGLEVRDVRRCPRLCTAPLGRRPFFLPPRARAPPPRCGRLQARRRTELLPTISLFAIDLPAPFAARLDARALRRSCARTPKSGQLVPAARIDGAERARVLCRCGGEGADAARCAAQPAPNVVPRPAA